LERERKKKKNGGKDFDQSGDSTRFITCTLPPFYFSSSTSHLPPKENRRKMASMGKLANSLSIFPLLFLVREFSSFVLFFCSPGAPLMLTIFLFSSFFLFDLSLSFSLRTLMPRIQM